MTASKDGSDHVGWCPRRRRGLHGTCQRSPCVVACRANAPANTWRALIQTRPDLRERLTVEVAGHYSNRPDLLEQLQRVAAILSNSGQDDDTGAKVTAEYVVRSRRLRDRFSSEDLQTMIDLYRSGATAKQVAEKFGVSLRSVKRLLRQHGIHRERCAPALESSSGRGTRQSGVEGGSS